MSFNCDDVLRLCSQSCIDYISSRIKMPSHIYGDLSPLPEDMLVFCQGYQLPGFPQLPGRVVVRTKTQTLRNRWICLKHWSGRAPQDISTIDFELDNYGNILMIPVDGSIPVYTVRSLVAYNSDLLRAAMANGLLGGPGWLRRSRKNIGRVPCDMCGYQGDGGLAGFDGCAADCLPYTMRGGDIVKLANLTEALARHTDNQLHEIERWVGGS